ncbi:MAG: class I SAM-dependent methyltransferase [Deltaproteobacteria bacterium]|nr:class I SAM-dependent methyltransferase [Deltaproteobacteria bacterium]MDH3382425.1 class I SAM-dependent methyltransferase [Deltaproteobacteria bacterium]
MEDSNSLSQKEYGSGLWRDIPLPARYFYANYAHQVIDRLISRFVSLGYSSFLEIGGCPGRWADYFYTRHHFQQCDSLDYDANNAKIIQENYQLLGIPGKAIVMDAESEIYRPEYEYDVVLSDGLVEHFRDFGTVFHNHVKSLKKNGLLIICVPNIKKSWFYDYFAKKDAIGYTGYRHVDKDELIKQAKDNRLEVLFCGYAGVFNIGLVHSNALSNALAKLFVVTNLILDIIFKKFRVKKESKTFSPYIYLIAKRNE